MPRFFVPVCGSTVHNLLVPHSIIHVILNLLRSPFAPRLRHAWKVVVTLIFALMGPFETPFCLD